MRADRFHSTRFLAPVGALLLVASCHESAPAARTAPPAPPALPAPPATYALPATTAPSANERAVADSIAPFAPAGQFDLRDCPEPNAGFIYSDITMDSEITGDLSGTEVYLARTDDGWLATGGAAGGSPPRPVPVREIVLAADSGKRDALFRVALPFNDRPENDWVIDGRIDCDSIWGNQSLRGGQSGAPVRALLRRKAPRPVERGASDRTHPAGALLRTAPLGGRPFAAAIAPDGTAYVTQLDSGSVAQAERPDRVFARRLKVGRVPSQIRVGPTGLVYVGNQETPSIDVIDGETGRLQSTWPLPSSVLTLGLAPDGTRVYALTSRTGMLVMNAQSGALLATVDVGATPTGIAFHPARPLVYVSARDGGMVRTVDMRTHAVVDSLVTKGSPQNVAASPDGTELYVTDISNSTLQIWNLETSTLRGVSPIGHPAQRNAFDVAVTPDGTQIWVTALADGSVVVVDRKTLRDERTIQLGGSPRYIAFDAKGTLAVIPNEAGWVSVVH